MSKERVYIVQKYVKAKDIPEAIKKEKKQNPDEVFLDSDWKKTNLDVI